VCVLLSEAGYAHLGFPFSLGLCDNGCSAT
jgi:hypothetical protein